MESVKKRLAEFSLEAHGESRYFSTSDTARFAYLYGCRQSPVVMVLQVPPLLTGTSVLPLRLLLTAVTQRFPPHAVIVD